MIDRSEQQLTFTLHDLLADYGLERYYDAFSRNDVDLDILPDLTDADLKEIGVHSLGHRRKLRRMVNERLVPQDQRQAGSEEPRANLEKRQVTVMFVDLADFTSLSHRFTSEQMIPLLEYFFDRVDTAIVDLGGRIDKHIGDCTVAIFGLEGASGHEAFKAVAAAEAIHRNLAEPDPEFGVALRAHIGIASGQVVIRREGSGGIADGDYTLAGNSISLASRLSDEARTDETLITDDIYRQLADLVDCSDPVELSVKGFPQPIKVRKFLSVTEAANTPLFVGREYELGQLEALLDACGRGTGAVCCIKGEPGIGKTTLVNRFLGAVGERGIPTASTLVLDFGGSQKAHPVQTIARQLVVVASGAAASTDGGIEVLYRNGLVDERSRLFLYLLCGLSVPADLALVEDALDPKARSEGRREALQTLCRLAAASGRLVVFVEDMHWADPLLSNAAALMAREAETLPLLLLMTTRPVEPAIDTELREDRGLTHVRTLDLAELDGAAAVALATGLGANASDELIGRCVARAEGNPLFLRQLVLHLDDSGESEVPGSIQSIIQSRLDQCTLRERRLLEAAAVLGQRFNLEAVKWVSGDAQAHLGPLIKSGLIERRPEDFLFGHALIRDSVYDLMISDRRRDLHRKAADWVRDTDLELHAEHLDCAGDPAAPAAYLAAATALRADARPDPALRLVERALHLQVREDIAWALRLLRADLLLDTGQSAAALDAYRLSRDTAPDARSGCRATIGLIGAMRLLDRIDEAHALLDEAQELAEREDFAEELSDIHYYRGSLFFPAGNTDGCLTEHSDAVRHAERAGAVEHKCRALSGMGDAYYAQGRMRTAHSVIGECLTLARTHGLSKILAANLFMLGTVRIYLNETDGALEDTLKSVEIAEKTGTHRAEIVSRLTAGWIHISMGQLGPAREQIQTALAVADGIGAKRFEAFLQESLARVQLYEGDRDGAVATIEAAVEGMRGGGERFIGPWVLGTLARITRDSATRDAALAEAEALLAEGCVGHNYYRFHQAAMATAADLRDPTRLRHHAESLERYTSGEPAPWSDYHIRRARLLADILDGARDKAALEAEFDAVSEICRHAKLHLSATLDAPYRAMLAS